MKFLTAPLLALCLALAGGLFVQPVAAQQPAAASPCRGLDEAACKAKAGAGPEACQWLPATTLKNGKERKALCRATPPCLGLAEAACTADAKCTWLKAGKNKAGKDVPARCRKAKT
ncbi:MAG: hypothetical protein NW205_11985 [Hyphomicrobiaceae bacterium]|nr:hypothetical protein [Hyphomicrobiaceae bacterium]